MEKYYIVKNTITGKELKAETAAGAYEAYDCFGKFDVIIEKHILENGFHYIDTYKKMSRRATKAGFKYYFREIMMSERRAK